MYSLTQKLRFFESVFGSGRLAANGKNFGVRCPICKHSDPNKRKLVIRVDDDICHCWTCGWKSRTVAPLIKKFGTSSQFMNYRDEFMPTRFNSEDDNDVEENKIVVSLPSDFQLLTLASLSDPDVRTTWSYLKSRGVTQKDAWYYKLGISNEFRWKRRIIMPSYNDQGDLNFFVARNIDSNDRRPKYDGPELNKISVIFNEINIDWSRRLVICEGPFDLMKCGENAVSLLGSDIDERYDLFNKIITNETPVILALDGDMWNTKIPKVYKKFEEYDVNVKVIDLRPWKDPGNMTKNQFNEQISSATHLTWENIFFDKLSNLS